MSKRGKTQHANKPSPEQIAAMHREIAEWERTGVPCAAMSTCEPNGTPVWGTPPILVLSYDQRPDVLAALRAYHESGADEIVSEWRGRTVGDQGMIALFLTLPSGFRFHVALPLLRDPQMDTAIYHLAVTHRVYIPLGHINETDLFLSVELIPFPDLQFFAASPTLIGIMAQVQEGGGIIDRAPRPADLTPAQAATYRHNQDGHMRFVRRNWEQLAGQAWQGYQAGGRGFLLIRVKDVSEPQPFAPALYVSATKAATLMPNWDSDPIARAVAAYTPETSMVVVFSDDVNRASLYRLTAGGSQLRPADAPPPRDSAQQPPMA